MIVEKFLVLSKSILCLSVAVTILFVIPYIINSQLTALRNDAKTELENYKTTTTKLINARADSLQTFVTTNVNTIDKRIDSIEGRTFKLTSNVETGLLDLINQNLGEFNSNLNTQLGILNTNLNTQLGTFNTNNNAGPLITEYTDLPKRFDLQTDCTVNALCWQNLATDTLVNFRFTGRDISTSTKVFNEGFPILMKGADTTVTNFASITDNINKLTKPKWYDRLLGYGLNGVIIYRDLNPVTNLTLKGVQFLTSH